MGVIKKEGLKESAVTYIGVLIGIVNTVYFYPKFFSEEELGLFRFLIDSAALLFPFISLGIHNLSVRMFPVFRNEKNGHNGLLYFLMIGVIIGYLIFLAAFFLLYPFFEGIFEGKSLLIITYWPYIIPLSGLVILATICTQYILNFKKVLLPSVFNELYIKIGVPLIALGCYFDVMTVLEGVFFLLGIFILRVVSLMSYIIYLKEWHWKPNWKFLNPPLVKEMRIYSFYGILGSLGGIMATRIDIFMVALLATNDLKDVGVYSIAMFMANVISVPSRAISNIASPVIADAWKVQDMANIDDIYKKSSIILITIGMLCLIGIWCSIDDIFALMPNGDKYVGGKYVLLILGIGKLVDLATGTNGQIISYSKYFRFNFYAVLLLAVLNIVSNFIFIPIFEINGAALATTISLVIFNLVKYLYIKIKMDLDPFTWNTLKATIIGLLVLAVGSSVPSVGGPFIDIIVRSTVITLLFTTLTLYFKVSPEINDLFWQSLAKIGIKK